MTPAFPKPVRRRKPKRRIPSRRATPRRRAAGSIDEKYLAFVRGCECVAPHGWREARVVGPGGNFRYIDHAIFHGLTTRSDPHHTVSRGAGGRDRDAIPLFRTCHQDCERLANAFTGWTKAQRKEWYAKRVAETHAAYRAAGGILVGEQGETP